MSALALALLLQVGSGPADSPELRYPLRMDEPEFGAPGDPFQLVDLHYGFSDTFATTHAFAARVLVEDRFYLGALLEGERRALTFSTARLALKAEATDEAYDVVGSYKTPRVIVSARVHRGSPAEGEDWRVTPAVAVRLSPDLELLGELSTDSQKPGGRLLRSTAAGFFWQKGSRLEAEGRYEHVREETQARVANVRDTVNLRAEVQAGRVELRGRALFDDIDGRFPRREGGGALGVRVPLTPHLLFDGAAEARFGRGVGERLHIYGGALTWFARRFTLPRSGASAERSLTLARRAGALGLNERRVFDEPGRREQRERLSLSGRKSELLDDLRLLYQAQLEERPVPTLQLGFEATDDALSGFRTRTANAKVGVPWPKAWPWARDEAAVPFLVLDLEREQRLSGASFEAIRYGASLKVELNRDLELVLGWSRADPTPLDLIRGIGRSRTFEGHFTYARGR